MCRIKNKQNKLSTLVQLSAPSLNTWEMFGMPIRCLEELLILSNLTPLCFISWEYEVVFIRSRGVFCRFQKQRNPEMKWSPGKERAEIGVLESRCSVARSPTGSTPGQTGIPKTWKQGWQEYDLKRQGSRALVLLEH